MRELKAPVIRIYVVRVGIYMLVESQFRIRIKGCWPALSDWRGRASSSSGRCIRITRVGINSSSSNTSGFWGSR